MQKFHARIRSFVGILENKAEKFCNLTKISKKKSAAQEVRHKRDISDPRSITPFNPYFVRETAVGSLCDQGVILHQK